MNDRSIKLAQLALLFSVSSAVFGFAGGLAAGSIRDAPPTPPPAFCPPPRPEAFHPPPVCPPCPTCSEPVLPRRGILFTPSGLPEWGAGYENVRLADGDPSTYWCSPTGAATPMTATLLFERPAYVEALEIDNRISGYETSGAREVRIEALDLGGAVMRTTTATLPQASTTVVPFANDLVASGVRVTVLSTFGGDYTAIAEIVVHGATPRPL